MKYRIKEEAFPDGQTLFYPQRKVLWFWCHFSEPDYGGEHTKSCKTIYEAEHFLTEYLKLKEESKIKYHPFS